MQAKLIRDRAIWKCGTILGDVETDPQLADNVRSGGVWGRFTPKTNLPGLQGRLYPGKDVRILDAPDHLYNGHDDVISACYWADRLLSPDWPKRVYQTHEGLYAIRSLRYQNADSMSLEHAEATDPIIQRWSDWWGIAAMWRPRPKLAGRHFIGGRWDFCMEENNRELGAEGDMDDYALIQSDIEQRSILTEHLALDRIEAYIGVDDVTSVIVKYEYQNEAAYVEKIDLSSPTSKYLWWGVNQESHTQFPNWRDVPDILEIPHFESQNVVDFAEIWISDDSRPFELGTTYWRIK